MELGGQIVDLFDLDDLLLVVAGFLLNSDGVLIFFHSEGDQLLGDGADFLRTGFGGNDLAVPKKRSGEVPEHSVTLVARLTKFTVRH